MKHVTIAILNQLKSSDLKMSFKSLVFALSEQRQEIKQALTLFPFFDTWDNNVITECCQLSKIIEFSPDEIILGSGSANSHMTFFILEGVCKIIHHLLVRVRVDSYGRVSYNLYKPEESGPLNSQLNNLAYTSLLFNQKHDFEEAGQTNEDQQDIADKEETIDPYIDFKDDKPENSTAKLESGSGLGKAVKGPSAAESSENEIHKNIQTNLETETHDPSPNETIHGDGEKNDDGNFADHGRKKEKKVEKSPAESEDNKKDAGLVAELAEEQKPRDVDNTLDERTEFEADHRLKVLEKVTSKSKQIVRLAGEKFPTAKPKDVKSFFVQVALFYKGACFGLEENMKDTFIMSATKVKCLRIPRRFLLQHNPCNIWNRIRLFFNLYLPPEKQIFEYVKSHRNWNDSKRKKSEEITSVKRIPNYILCAEVPFSIRLQDTPY